MKIRVKDISRFRLEFRGGDCLAEARVEPDGKGGWVARAQLMGVEGEVHTLGRIFRSRDRKVALEKMIRWIRGRFPGAQALAESARLPSQNRPGLSRQHHIIG